MSQRLLGMETEYGLSVILRSGARGSTEHAAEEIVTVAGEFPHLPALRSSGIFLANGSRFYVDCGTHPELATPECMNPWDVCRYVQAGDRMLAGLAARLKERNREIARTFILKGNVDYRTGASWGCHESYLHRGIGQGALSSQIIPHLVSRIIYSGAGGFNCHSPGIEFMVSPRVAQLHTAVSGDSTGDRRGIFHTRNESLCSAGYGRLHILCGESLRGQTGAWLKVATTALVVALIEAGKLPGDRVEFRDPVAAMRAFAVDPSCSRTAMLADGRAATAIEVQRHFLEQAEAHAGASFMPPWAGEVCRHWRAMLDRLKHGAARVAGTLDWAIKLALFQNHARRHHTTLEALAGWSPILAKLSSAVAEADDGPRPLTAAHVLSRKSPLASERKRLDPLLRERGLEWDGLAAVLSLRLELFEIDTRYGILGEGGIFDALDAGGVLDHRFSGVDNIPHALENPPANGRASIRGACIRRVAGQNGRFAAEWDGVWDLHEGRQLDLADPFCGSEKWISYRREPPPSEHPSRLFRAGRYAELLERIPQGWTGDVDDVVLSYARLGRRDEALAALRLQRPDALDFRRFALTVWIYATGLVPDADAIEPLLEEGNRFIEEMSGIDGDYSGFVFLACKGLFFMERGLLSLAEALFIALLANPANANRSRMYARTQCFLAELYRRLGRHDRATDLACAAAIAHRGEQLLGDSAFHSLPLLAKLATIPGQAAEFLSRSEAIHRAQRNELGLAHVLCLRARLLRTAHDRGGIEGLLTTVPVLATCKVARRILGEWDSWIAPGGGEPVDYWGL